jgi:hypothetical protein
MCHRKLSNWTGSLQIFVANLCPESTALAVQLNVANGKQCKTLENSSVAATFEKAKT